MKEIKASTGDAIKLKLDELAILQPYFIKYVIFGVSALYTILFFRSQAASDLSLTLQTLLGFTIELAKYNLPTIAVVGYAINRPVHWSLRLVAGVLAVACFYYSIIATQGFQLIELDKVNQIKYQDSLEYKSGTAKEKRIQSQIDEKKALLETEKQNLVKAQELDSQKANLSTDLNNQIKDINSQIADKQTKLTEAIQKGWQNTKTQLQNDINLLEDKVKRLEQSRDITSNKADEVQKRIDSLNKDIDDLNKQINTVSDQTASGTNKEKQGYEKLFPSQEALNKALFWLSILIEFIGVFFSIMVGLKKRSGILRKQVVLYYDDEDSAEKNKQTFFDENKSQQFLGSQAQNMDTVIAKMVSDTVKAYAENYMGLKASQPNVGFVGPNESVITSSKDYDLDLKKKPMGFHMETSNSVNQKNCNLGMTELSGDFTKEDITEYLEFMYDFRNGDQSPGTDKFFKETNLTWKQVRGIRFYLEKLGIIKVGTKKTNILVDLEQAIGLIQGLGQEPLKNPETIEK